MSQGLKYPGDLVKHGLAPKFNLILDIDHTLIFAFETNCTRILPGTVKDSHLVKVQAPGENSAEIHLVVREGV